MCGRVFSGLPCGQHIRRRRADTRNARVHHMVGKYSELQQLGAVGSLYPASQSPALRHGATAASLLGSSIIGYDANSTYTSGQPSYLPDQHCNCWHLPFSSGEPHWAVPSLDKLWDPRLVCVLGRLHMAATPSARLSSFRYIWHFPLWLARPLFHKKSTWETFRCPNVPNLSPDTTL